MLKIFLIFLAFIVGFVLLLRGAVILMGRVAGRYVGEKHKEAESIINTGKPPKNWTYRLEKKIAKLKETSGRSGRILKIQKKAKNTCLDKLDRLIKYFKGSPLVEDEETRKILLDELAKVRQRWKEKDGAEIISPESTPPLVRI